MKFSQFTFLFLFIVSFTATAGDDDLKSIVRPFKTDLCTGWFDQSFKYDWSRCCVIHDLYFWAGGTKDHRKLADLRLKSCVKEEANSFHATLIYLGVKAGSLSPVKLKSKKWGNAWPEDYQFSSLSTGNLEKLKVSLQKTLSQNSELQDILTSTEVEQFFNNLKNLNLQKTEGLPEKRPSH